MRHKICLLIVLYVVIGCSGDGAVPAPAAPGDAGASRPATCASYCAAGQAADCAGDAQRGCQIACESVEADGPCYSQLQEQMRCGVAVAATQWSCDAAGEATPGAAACPGQPALEDCLASAYAACDDGSLVLAEFWQDGVADCSDASDEA